MTLPAGLCAAWIPTWSCAIPTGSYAVTGTAVAAASEILYALSGRQFGLCTETLRPCAQDCYGDTWPALGGSGYAYPRPTLHAGQWYNLVCGGCGDDCSCTTVSSVQLPVPTHAVTVVKVDGVTLVAGTDYRLDDGSLLVRLGGASWPRCNDLNLPDTEVGTWSVTIQYGQPVPTLGAVAVGELGHELALMLACDDGCRLPRQVQSVSRQGVNVTFVDAEEFVKGGQTGMYWVDLFVRTYNPGGLRQRSRAYDIDSPDRYRRF